MNRLPYIKPVRPRGRLYLYYFRDRRRWGDPLPTDVPESHPTFLRAYLAAEAVYEASKGAPSGSAHTPREGTIGHLCASYVRSDAFRDLRQSTRETRLRIVDKIRAKWGDALTRDLAPRHIRADLEGLTVDVANNRLKVWRALGKFAVNRDMIESNPAAPVEKRRHSVRRTGHHCWTDDEIAQFRHRHPSGSKPRLAFELALWTGARRSDLVTLGRQLLSGGSLTYTAKKNGRTACIPVLPEFQRELDQMPKSQMLFLETRSGRPHSEKAFGAWFRRQCAAAGLPARCALHGLRKARARILAEQGRTAHQIMAWLAWATLAEAQHYTESVDRRRLTHGENEERIGETPPNPSGNARAK